MKKSLLIVTCTILLFAVTGFWTIGRRAYRHARESRAVRQAVAFFNKADFRNASLSARQTLLVNPANVEACVVMAKLAELTGSPQALDWRRRIVELSPTMQNKLDLAALAMRVHGPPYALTCEILEQMSRTGTNKVGYCNLAAELALKRGNRAGAAAWLEVAQRLQPANALHSLNLAVLQLTSTNEDLASAARVTLDRFRDNTNFSLLALRSLVAERLIRKDLTGAASFSTELLNNPQAGFEDELRHLEILQQADLPEFESFLTKVQQQTSTNAPRIYELSALLVRRGLAGRARQWLTNCPKNVQTNQPVPLAFVDCLITLKDWQAAERFLENKKWGEFEPMRLALLSRTAVELRETSAADVRWRLAVNQARRRLGALMWLLARAEEWHRPPARVELLWEIVQQFPAEHWALQELTRDYTATGNTRGLHQAYGRIISVPSEDRFARNDFAATGLLLRTNLPRMHEIARQLYSESPLDPTIASTFAYSLHVRGRSSEGLTALESLDTEVLARPNIALYYGALLRANGQTNMARKYLALAEQATLLPEERDLLRSCNADLLVTRKHGWSGD